MQDMGTLTSSSPAAPKDEPRAPPPSPTPLDFPCCKPLGPTGPRRDFEDDLVKLFGNIVRTGPTETHLDALNISLVGNVPLDLLLPSDFIPPFAWLHDPTAHDDPGISSATPSVAQSLSNGALLPSHNAFYPRVRELLFENEDAFRAIQRRSPAPNRAPARIAHFRRFWDGLLLMSEYWDTSLDDCTKTGDEEDKCAMDIDEVRAEAQQIDENTGIRKRDSQDKETYTGRRRDTGKNMPGKYREDTVYALVETLSWAFRCRLEHPHLQAKVRLQGVNFPLPHLGSVYRTPKDIRQAKSGILEGPMFGVFCRDQTSFRREEEAVGEGKQEMLDLLKETGLMLMLAQKRAREGKEEEVPGKGKWWANAPRWGGGKGGDLGVSEEAVVEESASSDAPRKRSKKMNHAELWKNIRPPASLWEKGITYLQIGKAKDSEYENVRDSSVVVQIR